MMETLNQLRRSLFEGSMIPDRFHAAEDRQQVRDRVFEANVKNGTFTAHVFVADKVATPEKLQGEADFYTFFADFALRGVLQYHPQDDPIYLITDAIPVKRKREAVIKGSEEFSRRSSQGTII